MVERHDSRNVGGLKSIVGRAVVLLLTIALHVLLLAPVFSGVTGTRTARKPAASELAWIELAGSNAPTLAPSLPLSTCSR